MVASNGGDWHAHDGPDARVRVRVGLSQPRWGQQWCGGTNNMPEQPGGRWPISTQWSLAERRQLQCELFLKFYANLQRFHFEQSAWASRQSEPAVAERSFHRGVVFPFR